MDGQHPPGEIFPNIDTGADAYVGIAPVAQYPPNGYGLYDVGGNVWEWTTDWYRPDYYAQLAASGTVARNRNGSRPNPSIQAEPTEKKHVHRGGSFLCTDRVLFPIHGRYAGKGEVTTGTNHVGFRLVKTP